MNYDGMFKKHPWTSEAEFLTSQAKHCLDEVEFFKPKKIVVPVLDPCPFCGGEGLFGKTRVRAMSFVMFVRCKECRCRSEGIVVPCSDVKRARFRSDARLSVGACAEMTLAKIWNSRIRD